ncbi:MAG: hypothetical protein LBQ94_06060 [Treponema sp.]|nr:hypothetical protein [Treponema sp.]
MKKYICVLFLGFFIFGICIAQVQENTWKGTVRFNPADMFVNLHNALPGMYVTWTPYILPNLGIPAEIDVNLGWGVLPGVEVSLLTGAEYIPIGPSGKDKNGLFLDAKAGLSFFFNEGVKAAFVGKSNIGYQFITNKGFVATPAVGAVYNGRSGFGLNLMFDLGFAYGSGE